MRCAVFPSSRSAVWTGEVLGLPEIFKDEEPAHRPKAAGTPLPVQEPGGLQGGGECPRVRVSKTFNDPSLITLCLI